MAVGIMPEKETQSREVGAALFGWASRLSIERACTLQELFLETEPEWRLYEDLSASGVSFELEPGPPVLRDPEDPGWRVWFVIKIGLRIRYAGADGFLVRSDERDRYVARPEDVLEIITESL